MAAPFERGAEQLDDSPSALDRAAQLFRGRGQRTKVGTRATKDGNTPLPAAARARTSSRIGFSAVEMAAIQLGMRDSRVSIRAIGARARILRWIFGLTPAPALADPKLEALRRYVVARRHGTDSSEEAAFLAAGYSVPQADRIGRMLGS